MFKIIFENLMVKFKTFHKTACIKWLLNKQTLFQEEVYIINNCILLEHRFATYQLKSLMFGNF